MVDDRQQLPQFCLAESGREHVVLLPRHLLVREPRLEETACRRAVEVAGHERIQFVTGKRLLCQQNLHAGAVRDALQYLQVAR